MDTLLNSRTYQLDQALESQVGDYLSIEFRKKAFTEVVNPTTRLDIVIRKIADDHPDQTFSPKQLAYMIGMDPKAPRALGTMIRAIVKRKPNFPSYVMKTSSKTSYSVEKTDELYKEFGIL